MSCKEHFQLSTQPELGAEIAFVPPPPLLPPPLTSICPKKSRIAGKALETKGAGWLVSEPLSTGY